MASRARRATTTGMEPAEIADLQWLVRYGDGEASGLRCAFPREDQPVNRRDLDAFYSALRCGPIHVGAETHAAGSRTLRQAHLDAATRYVCVSRRLRAAGREGGMALILCYVVEPFPDRIVFGAFGNVVDWLPMAAEAHRRSRSPRPMGIWLNKLGRRVHAQQATDQDQITFREIALQAQAWTTQAVRAYRHG